MVTEGLGGAQQQNGGSGKQQRMDRPDGIAQSSRTLQGKLDLLHADFNFIQSTRPKTWLCP